jgi:hypothetical protein
VSKPAKRPPQFDPIGDFGRWAKTCQPTPSAEEQNKRLDAAMEEIQRRGGDELLLEHLERHIQLSAADRALELGGEDLASCFRTLALHGVSKEGLEKALDYLEPMVRRALFRRTRARETMEASEVVPRLRAWLRDGYALLRRRFEAEGGVPPFVRDIMRR